MNAFAAAVDALFADPNLARDAIWRSGGGGDGAPVRVVLRAPDQVTNFGAGRFVTVGRMLDVRIADVPSLEAGDTFEIGAETFTVQGEPLRDAEGLIWTAEVRPA
jgi:hypothetical protein